MRSREYQEKIDNDQGTGQAAAAAPDRSRRQAVAVPATNPAADA
jgi:hypothetical protein